MAAGGPPAVDSHPRPSLAPRAVTLANMFGVRMHTLPGPGLMLEPECLFLVGRGGGAGGEGAGAGGTPATTPTPTPPPRPHPQANHRTWADFFLDVVATGGRGQMLSRAAVAAAFPAFMAAVCVIRSVILFRRGRVFDKAAFNAMIRQRMRASPVEGLIVYPEGHRSTAPGPLPLKRGMLQYAWQMKVPVQVVMSAGKEAVVAEKECATRFGRDVVVGYSLPLRPTGFSDFDAFMAAVQAAWDAEWDRVAGARVSDARPTPAHNSMARSYPLPIRAAQVVVTGTILAIFLAIVAWSVLTAARLHAALGAAGTPLALALAAWCAASAGRALTAPAPVAAMQPIARKKE